MSDEDWVKAAMTDDSVVVELLVGLHQAKPPPPPSKGDSSHLALPPLEWSVRQRRSNQILHHSNKKKKKKQTPRASPTTPLSWSGGATSVSGGSYAAEGFEESSLLSLKRMDAARSKVTATCETTANKRARKKKTLAELKEEEILLVKERRQLKRELATLRVTLEKQRTTNESLKRLKLNLESLPAVKSDTAIASTEATPDQIRQQESSTDPIHPISPPEVRTDDDQENQEPNISSQLQPNQENQCALPDLNLPLDDDFNS